VSSFNRVILMGNLTRDPEVRFTQGGMGICTFSLAVNERFKGSDGEYQDRATFVEVTMFGKRGEAFGKFHRKGAAAFIEGKLRLDQWDDKETGAKRSKLFVVADSFEFVNGADKKEKSPQGGAQDDYSGDDWNAPVPANGARDYTPF
jgi:single-strand DNA-binding protein